MEPNAKGSRSWTGRFTDTPQPPSIFRPKSDSLLRLVPFLGGLRVIVRQEQFGGPGVPSSAAAHWASEAERKRLTEGLSCFALSAQSTVENFEDKFTQDDKDQIQKAVEVTHEWLQTHQLGTDPSTVEGLQAKQKELEDIVNPIIWKGLLKCPHRS